MKKLGFIRNLGYSTRYPILDALIPVIIAIIVLSFILKNKQLWQGKEKCGGMAWDGMFILLIN